VDVEIARRGAQLHVPNPRPERDALIAATALTHGLIVATHNISDFESLGVAVLNPWQTPAA
jgi:toxin FitB